MAVSRRAGGRVHRAARERGRRSVLPAEGADATERRGGLPPWPAGAAVLADDLTGALDGGVQLLPRTAVEVLVSSRDGVRTGTPTDLPECQPGQSGTRKKLKINVPSSSGNALSMPDAARHGTPGTAPGATDAADAVVMPVINTQSRGLAPAAAAARVSAACRALRSQGRTVWFKKLDSALRGNVGAELAALHEALAPCVIICTPALPAERRTVRGGVLRVAGEPVMATPYRDEIPARDGNAQSSAVIDIVRRQWPECRAMQVSALPREELAAALCGMADLIVVDAASDTDLNALAAAAGGVAPGVRKLVWAGSAGLLRALTRTGTQPQSTAGLRHRTPARVTAADRPGDEPPLVVISGSRRAMARRQVDKAVAASSALLLRLRGTHGGDRHEPSWQVADTADCDKSREIDTVHAATLAASALDRRHDLFLCAPVPVSDAATHQPARAVVAAELAALVGDVLAAAATRPRALLIVGGDTAYACLIRLGVRRLRLAGEAAPYVPCAQASSGPWAGLKVITKAGGFGDPHTLQRICAQLRGDGN